MLKSNTNLLVFHLILKATFRFIWIDSKLMAEFSGLELQNYHFEPNYNTTNLSYKNVFKPLKNKTSNVIQHRTFQTLYIKP